MDAGGLVSSLVMAALVGYQIWRRGRSSRHAVLEAVTPPRRLPGEFEADVDAVLADVAGKSPDAIYREGVSLVQPFIGASDFPLDPERLGRGLALLEHVVRLVPTNWAAMWILGMGYRRTRSLVRSRDFLARAYASAPDRVETLVEYQRACLWLGQTDEALPLAQRQVQRTGGNADSRSNLAITLLLHGDVDGAATEAAAAVDRAPDDIVIQRVRALVADVRDGRRVRPRSLLELETPAVPPVGAALLPEEAQTRLRRRVRRVSHGAASRSGSHPDIRGACRARAVDRPDQPGRDRCHGGPAELARPDAAAPSHRTHDRRRRQRHGLERRPSPDADRRAGRCMACGAVAIASPAAAPRDRS